TVSLNGLATEEAVNALMQNVTILTPAITSAAARTISYRVWDDANKASDIATVEVAIDSELEAGAPILTGISGQSQVTYTEDSAPVMISSAAVVTDPDGPSFANATVTVTITEGGTADDQLAIRYVGT